MKRNLIKTCRYGVLTKNEKDFVSENRASKWKTFEATEAVPQGRKWKHTRMNLG